MAQFVLQLAGSKLLEMAGQAAVIAGTLLLTAGLIALVAYAYRNLGDDGMRWPEDVEQEDGGVHQGDEDDEWDYY
jgi:hypothetical protein